jgi:YidC/Oxa1 family membrane protein insertase
MDQRRILLAGVLSLAVLLLYNEFVVRPHQPRPPSATPTGVETPTTITQPFVPAQPPPGPSDAGYLSFEVGDIAPIVIETDLWRATLTSRGGRLTSVALKKFRQTVQPESPPLELVERSKLLPLTIVLGPGLSDAGIGYGASATTLTLIGDASGEVVFTATTDAGLHLEKHVRFSGNSYLIDVDLRATGTDTPRSISLVIPELEPEGLRPSGNATDAAVILSQGKVIETHFTDAKIEDLKAQRQADARWVALSVPFFAGAVVAPKDPGGIAFVERAGSRPIVGMEEPLVDGAAAFKVFLGPKSKEVLAEANFDLSRLLDFGWFWFIAIPMLYALRLLHGIFGNYGVDIILLTALVRAATIPLTQKSFRSMKEMQRIQPQLKRIQEQYKDDQAKLQKEMMELYRSHGVNPFSGCAPMVLQIPIFVGLYNALLHAIELRHAPFALWITDLSSPERLMVAGIGIPVMTLFMGGTMLVQQWLTPQQGDPTQRQMMMIMPIVFTFMFFNFPSGLVLYWLTSNLLGIAQQYVMLKSPK